MTEIIKVFELQTSKINLEKIDSIVNELIANTSFELATENDFEVNSKKLRDCLNQIETGRTAIRDIWQKPYNSFFDKIKVIEKKINNELEKYKEVKREKKRKIEKELIESFLLRAQKEEKPFLFSYIEKMRDSKISYEEYEKLASEEAKKIKQQQLLIEEQEKVKSIIKEEEVKVENIAKTELEKPDIKLLQKQLILFWNNFSENLVIGKEINKAVAETLNSQFFEPVLESILIKYFNLNVIKLN